jgi:hypothetical protein
MYENMKTIAPILMRSIRCRLLEIAQEERG